MRHRVLAPQQIAPEYLAIRPISIAFVHRQKAGTVATIETGQIEPGHAGMRMVDGMQIVVQEKQRKRPTILDDDGSGACKIVGRVLKKCPYP